MTDRLDAIAAAPRLLIGLDFDGVLAEIVPRPEDAVPLKGVAEVLAALVALPGVRVAAISGRRRADLESRLSPPDGVILIGEHGGDRGEGIGSRPARYEEVREALWRIAEAFDGAWVEEKHTGLTLHSRALAADQADEVARRAGVVLDQIVPGLHAPGHRVVDVRLTGATKGDAVTDLRHPDEAVLYIGDDTTDESVFEVLGEGDLGVKVGPGPTGATWRLADPSAVVSFLGELVSRRDR